MLDRIPLDGAIAKTIASISRQLPALDAKRAGIELFGAPRFNAFMLFSPNENTLSRIVQDLFDPLGRHGQGALFLNALLRKIGADPVSPIDTVQVRREVQTEAGRRIDLVIETPTALIGIENKPWAVQQANQLSDYLATLRHWSGAKQVELVFLSDFEAETAKEEVVVVTFVDGDRGYPSLLSLLEEVRFDIKAPRVRAHINEFIHYIAEHFGGQELPTEAELVFVDAVEHEFGKAESRRAIGAVLAAGQRLHRTVLGEVATVLRDHLGSEFEVVDDANLYDCLKSARLPWRIAKQGWPANLHLAIEADRENFRRVDFGVRAPLPGNAHAKAQNIECSGRPVLERALSAIPRGQKNNFWPWYDHCATWDWGQEFTGRLLLECPAGSIGDHPEVAELAEKFRALAQCVDNAMA